MKALEKREHRSYKMAEKPYQKALRRGVKEGKPLATMIERFADLYGKGYEIVVFPHTNEIKFFPKKNKKAK